MRTQLPEAFIATSQGQRANEILRACVHCGFCNATCPTYQVLGDERDGPRGRIYLMKEMFESGEPNLIASDHLDRCLTCRACETTCPSGVDYGELLEIGRATLEPKLQRSLMERMKRFFMLRLLPHPHRLARITAPVRWLRPLLPRRLRPLLPIASGKSVASSADDSTSVILLQGCVQRQLTPATNERLLNICQRLGLRAGFVADEGCCGGLALHLAEEKPAQERMVATASALNEALPDDGVIVSSASGCGVTVKDYGRLLAGTVAAEDGARVAEATLDVAEFLLPYADQLTASQPQLRLAVQTPCTLQHGQKLPDVVTQILEAVGYELVSVSDPHLCCGSAGVYSVLQPKISSELAERKLAALNSEQPDVIVSANVGCQTHLAGRSKTPVKHWLELIE